MEKGEIELPNGEDDDGAGEIGAGGEGCGAGMVIKAGKARSVRRPGEIVLDQPVHVDSGGGVAELHAGHQDEDEREHRVDRTHHLAAPAASTPPPRHRCTNPRLLRRAAEREQRKKRREGFHDLYVASRVALVLTKSR